MGLHFFFSELVVDVFRMTRLLELNCFSFQLVMFLVGFVSDLNVVDVSVFTEFCGGLGLQG